MSDFNEVNQGGVNQNPDQSQAAFCQNCGKPLLPAEVRRVGAAVYCEPCLEMKVAGAPGGYTTPPVYGSTGWVNATMADKGPNPGLAALLGFIPGVGAMYNEQYAKGIVHLMVFAVLVTLASDVNGIFGLFIAGWEFYMAIEAHHTAKARRDGTPLPNPFGLNDIGERLGFGKAWPQAVNVGGVAQDAAQAAADGFSASAYQARPAGAGYATPPPYSAPPVYGAASDHNAPPAGMPPTPAGWGAPADSYPYGAAYTPPGTGMPYGAPFVPPVVPPFVPPVRNRFPAGAVWLIGLGVLFLLANTRFFNIFRPDGLVGFGLIGLGVWLFLRRMLESGATLAGDGSPEHTLRVVRALKGSAWIMLVGLLFLLQAFHIVGWGHSWPAFIILAGVMMVVDRAAYNAVAGVTGFGAGYVPPVVAAEPLVDERK